MSASHQYGALGTFGWGEPSTLHGWLQGSRRQTPGAENSAYRRGPIRCRTACGVVPLGVGARILAARSPLRVILQRVHGPRPPLGPRPGPCRAGTGAMAAAGVCGVIDQNALGGYVVRLSQ